MACHHFHPSTAHTHTCHLASVGPEEMQEARSMVAVTDPAGLECDVFESITGSPLPYTKVEMRDILLYDGVLVDGKGLSGLGSKFPSMFAPNVHLPRATSPAQLANFMYVSHPLDSTCLQLTLSNRSHLSSQPLLPGRITTPQHPPPPRQPQ